MGLSGIEDMFRYYSACSQSSLVFPNSGSARSRGLNKIVEIPLKFKISLEVSQEFLFIVGSTGVNHCALNCLFVFVFIFIDGGFAGYEKLF